MPGESTENIVHKEDIVSLPDETKSPHTNYVTTVYHYANIVVKHHYANTVLKLIPLALIWGHFGWATWYFVEHTTDILDSTTCNGYGFLMILFILINFGVLYSRSIKPYLVTPVKKFLWTPTTKMFGTLKYGTLLLHITIMLAILAFVIYDSWDDYTRLVPLSGLCCYLILGYLLSANRRAIPWHTVTWGIILQFLCGLLTIKWEVGRNAIDCLGQKVATFLGYAVEGAVFVYGKELITDYEVFAFKSLATIYFLGFVINILYFYGIMQDVVLVMGKFLQSIMGTSICESVNSAANIFVGMSEAPLLLKPYLHHLTDSEIHSVMTSGFATVSGTVLAAYIGFGAKPAHLITSSVMSAPAALCYSKLMYPETEEIKAHKAHIKGVKVEFDSVLDAASKGAHDASFIVIAIISSVVAFLGAVYFLNGVLSWLGVLVGFTGADELWTVDLIVGKVFIPVAYVMGVPWDECEKVARLIGIKTMVNEFAAFQRLGEMGLTPRSETIATYSVCGFANPGSVGIMISALSALMPAKREVITRLVFSAFVGGCVTCFMTACIAAVLIPIDQTF